MKFSLCPLIVSAATATIVFPQAAPTGVFRQKAMPYSLDVVEVLDASQSQFDSMKEIRNTTMDAYDHLMKNYLDSRYALTTFTDFPRPPLGFDRATWKDWCLRVRASLGTDRANFESQVMKLNSGGGYDFPESQLDSILRAALAPQVGWRQSELSDVGLPIRRVMVIVTDSLPHTEGDALKAISTWNMNHPEAPYPFPVPNEFHVNSSYLLQDSPNVDCGSTEYPSIQQVAEVLKELCITPVFLVAPANFKCTSAAGVCVYPEFWALSLETQNPIYKDPQQCMSFYYTNMLKKMGIVGIVETLKNGYVGFHDKFISALDQVASLPLTCKFPTTTTSSTTTRVTTNKTTPTTTTKTNTPTKTLSMSTLPTKTGSLTSKTSTSSTTDNETDCSCAGCCNVEVFVNVTIDSDC